MTLDQLRYFCAVCQYNGVTSAANSLNISQPSVSAAIKSLEAEFDISLFHRKQKRLHLTQAGQQLLKLSLPLLQEVDTLSVTMKKFSKENAVLRLGVPPMIGSLFLPQLFKALPSLSSPLQLQVIEDDGNGLRRLLSEGKIDMALLPHTQEFDQTFNALKVARLENICCVQKGHPFSKLPRISLASLRDAPLVLFKNSFFQTERIINAFRALDIQPNVLLYTAQLSTVQNMIAEGTAIGFLFSFLAEQEQNLVGISLDPPMTTHVSLVWHKRLVLTEAMEALISYFKGFSM